VGLGGFDLDMAIIQQRISHKPVPCGYPKICDFTNIYVLVQDVSNSISALMQDMSIWFEAIEIDSIASIQHQVQWE
jgi:hypothetical protein